MENLGESWRSWGNLGEAGKISEKLGESWRSSENLGEARRILEKLGESWRSSENLGGGRAFVNSFWRAFVNKGVCKTPLHNVI